MQESPGAPERLTLLSSLVLNNGVVIPRIGLGVFQSRAGRETQSAVRWALEAGYRHVDTAHIYRNEADVGAALRESRIPRAELFVTTKLWNADQGYDQTLRAFESSVNTLGLEYVDLYLMHWPVPERRRDSWRAMETLLAAGRCRAIGVSNFTDRHLDELFAQSHIVPAVNQIEIHPYLQRCELIVHCHKHGIAVEAYSPLTKA